MKNTAENNNNSDKKTVEGFGDEWARFDQKTLIANRNEHEAIFNSYFAVFPWNAIGRSSIGFDLGCGSGRWAALVAPRVGHLHCIDPSEAIDVAKRNLSTYANCSFHRATVDAMPIEDDSMDFAYSLGVLHHVPDTALGITQCVKKLKKGAPFLIYLYYALDNKPFWYRSIWRLSDSVRRAVSTLPLGLRFVVSQMLALGVYLPIARMALILRRLGFNVKNFPLSAYCDKSYYTIRTDALDRFGTRLEQRFTKQQISRMMEDAGLENIRFSDEVPYWCAVGTRK